MSEDLAPHNLTYRLRLDSSIVSMSMTWRCRKPMRARFLSSSHPRPPAPTTSTQQWSRSICRLSGDGSKSGRQNGPERSSTFRRLLHRLCVSELIIAVATCAHEPRPGIRINSTEPRRRIGRTNERSFAWLARRERLSRVSSIYFLPFSLSFHGASTFTGTDFSFCLLYRVLFIAIIC